LKQKPHGRKSILISYLGGLPIVGSSVLYRRMTMMMMQWEGEGKEDKMIQTRNVKYELCLSRRKEGSGFQHQR
jgi:hypothetical protein